MGQVKNKVSEWGNLFFHKLSYESLWAKKGFIK